MTKETVTCPRCGRSFVSQKGLTKHLVYAKKDGKFCKIKKGVRGKSILEMRQGR